MTHDIPVGGGTSSFGTLLSATGGYAKTYLTTLTAVQTDRELAVNSIAMSVFNLFMDLVIHLLLPMDGQDMVDMLKERMTRHTG